MIYNHEIEFQPCCTQSQTSSIGKSIQMRGKSMPIWKNLSWLMRSNNLYFVHKNYALIWHVMNNQEIDFQPCCTQSQSCSIGKSIQMRGTSMSIWKNLSWQMRSNNLYFVHKNYALIRIVIYNKEIDFQPCCTQSQTCNTGKSIQMRWTSVSI